MNGTKKTIRNRQSPAKSRDIYLARGDSDSSSSSSDDDDDDGVDGPLVYKEISMPACDRAMLLCLVIIAVTVLILAIAAFMKADEALDAVLAMNGETEPPAMGSAASKSF